MIKIAPSVLAADPMTMGADVEKVLNAGAQWIHLDIMDGHFVPNLSYGPSVCGAMRKHFENAFLDVHLMLDNPASYLVPFLKAGAGAVTVHVEADGDKHAMLKEIREAGALSGMSLRPGTKIEELVPYLDELDMVLVMTVEPGFGGQKFKQEQLEKVKYLRNLGYKGEISVDGGVNMQNAPDAVQSGASVLVMGTAVFKADDPEKVIQTCTNLG